MQHPAAGCLAEAFAASGRATPPSNLRSVAATGSNGQYIIVEKQLSAVEALKRLDGKPVIASDTDNNRYFKRLRVGNDRVFLESMDSGGDYAPVILALPGQGSNCLEQVWPVAGVLFELPN